MRELTTLCRSLLSEVTVVVYRSPKHWSQRKFSMWLYLSMMATMTTMTMNIVIIIMMKQGNACQVYPKVISFYSEPPHAIAWTEIGINSANMLLAWFGLVCFGMRFFGLILCLINISDNMWGTRQIHSLCMLLKISLLQTGLQVDFGMCLQDIKGLDSGSTYLDIHHNSEFHHPHNCQFGIRFGMFSPLWDTFAKKRSRLAKSFRLAIILYSSLCRCKLWH